MNIKNVRNCLSTRKVCSGFLPIIPQPKQSARFYATIGKGGKCQVRSYTDPKKANYVKQLAILFKPEYDGQILETAIKFTGVIVIPFLKSQRKADKERGFCLHIVKGDTDNFLKPFQDSLEGILYKNDSQLMWHDVVKVRGEVAGFHYTFEEVGIF